MNKTMTQSAIKIALEQTIEGLQLIDREWRYVYINTAAASHGQSKKEDLLGRTMLECYPGIENTPFFEHLKYVMENNEVRTFENEFLGPDGTKHWFELHLEPNDYGVLIRSVDINDKKIIESQFRHSQKMEAIGRLAGEVAHDFNNKLAVIMAYCEMAKMNADDKPLVESYINKILSAVNMSAALTRQMLAFSRRQILDLKMTNLNELLEESQDGLANIIGDSIALNCKLSSDLSLVNVDPLQIDQVIINLILNARDAMPDGGTITVETSNVVLCENYASTHPNVKSGSYVLLSVTDTGVGMTPEVLERAFEPFYTTKPMEKGTGLGLSSVHGIINQSHGHIEVDTGPNQGTTFKIYLPVAS